MYNTRALLTKKIAPFIHFDWQKWFNILQLSERCIIISDLMVEVGVFLILALLCVCVSDFFAEQ